MNESPDQQLLEAIAAELGVDPSFVEKDWHATRMLPKVAGADYGGPQPVFSGGTSLSKAYGLIQRFSEDLDFKFLLPEDGIMRDARRRIRDAVVAAIRSNDGWTVGDDDVFAANESRFFPCEVEYSPIFDPFPPLRGRIRLEVTLQSPALPPEERSLQSFVSEARRQHPEIGKISCVAPTETAADKLSALTWRILSRRRDREAEDDNLVRHLHDLAALEEHAAKHPDFPDLVKSLIAIDTPRMGTDPEFAGMAPAQRLSTVSNLLSTDPEYRDRYRRFVAAMCYGTEDETPTFDSAIDAIQRLGRLLS